MKIGVDCHVLSGKYQGSRTYLFNLYKAVLHLNVMDEFIFFGHWNKSYPFGHSEKYVDFRSRERWKRLTYQTYPLIKNNNIAVFHSTYASPLLLPCKSILTIHDLLFETHPQFFDISERLRNKLLIRHSAKKATQIHTVSQFSKEALIDIYKIPEGLINIVPDGVDLIKFNPNGRDEASERINSKFHIKDYILTVGRLEPRKNHLGLIKAYSILKTFMKELPTLVIVGQKDFGYKDFFTGLHDLKLENDVKIIEDLDDMNLPDVYRGAKMFVYPSYAEGFGIPPLEAMASGVPVISSNSTAMLEIIGEGGLLVNPNKAEEIAEAMLKVLSNETFAKELSFSGRKRAEKWSWENSAKCYIQAITELRQFLY